MAKEITNSTQLSDEVARRQKERDEREKKEKEDQKKREDEKLQKKKEREKRIKAKEDKERKRIKNLINYPYKTLFQASSLVSLFTLIITYFWQGKELLKSMLFAFFSFSIIFIFVGLVLLAIYLILSQERIKEIEEQKRIEAEKAKEEEGKRLDDFSKMESEIKSQTQALKQNNSPAIAEVDEFGNSSMENEDEFRIPEGEIPKSQRDLEDQYMNNINMDANFEDYETAVNNNEFK
jgi:hypothetical protein